MGNLNRFSRALSLVEWSNVSPYLVSGSMVTVASGLSWPRLDLQLREPYAFYGEQRG
jgi:hypothetical protein